ncbi:MAG: Uroporphyrinogen synthase [Bryobacterales bacterium]|jgi:uroporphyrinogen-III synthase|nr:Uroporphyrinogen synthase [Bryobacterales bacterium]
MPFDGLRILALESRRAEEIATLIRKQGGDAFVAPSMREVPLEDNTEAFEFGERLLAGDYDCVILLTGVGTRTLWKALLTRYDEGELKAALAKVTVVVRGPKPSAALRELGITANVLVPQPNTWRETLETMKSHPEKRVVVQEYGKSNIDLLEGLRQQGRDVSTVRIYGWDLPEDTAPLREAVRRLAAGEADGILLTTATQLVNLMRIAEEEGNAEAVRKTLSSIFIGSIGPTTSEALEDYGLKATFEPSHPKMGLLVNEAAALISNKR